MVAFVIPCRCGKRTFGFNNDIGPFYVDKCCKKAGYDHLGNLKESSTTPPPTPTPTSPSSKKSKKSKVEPS